MPDRPQPKDVQWLLNDMLRRLRAVERLYFTYDPEDPPQHLGVYSWQSAMNLVTGFGQKYHADRDGYIVWVRGERSSGDGTGTAQFDVLVNDVSLFQDGVTPFPTVGAGKKLGSEVHFPAIGFDLAASNRLAFSKGDAFQVNVLNTGGGTGPLRLTISFIADLAEIPGSETLNS